MMESLPLSQHEEPLPPSLPHVYSAVRTEPTTDFWNPPLIHPASGVSENIPTYTSLEPVYPESSYAPSSAQYLPVSNTMQPLYSSCTMMQDEPLLHSALYRDPDQSHSLGSSPSYISSPTPPLPQIQSITNAHIVGLSRQFSHNDYHCSTSTKIQPLYSSCTIMETEPIKPGELPILSHTDVDEFLGSSTSPFSSTTPPLSQNQSISKGHTVELSRPSSNIDYSRLSTSSAPESTVSSNNSTALECSNCRTKNDVFWVSTHYLCRQCLPERGTTIVQQPLSGDCSGNKRKRSMTTNENANDVCTNCEATLTTLWRRSILTGNRVCNACRLYENLRHCPRPKHMRKDKILRRKRKPKASQASKVKSSSRKRSKKSTGESNLSPQYMPNEAYDISNYTLPTYNNTLQMTDFSSSVNNTHHAMLPPINNSQPFYAPYRPEMFNIYNSMPLNDIVNIPYGLPSNIYYASS